MSLASTRSQLLDALEAGGIRTATSGKLAPPCVLVEPGDPWSSPERMPGRVARWRLVAISAAPDANAAYGELAELADTIDAALKPLLGAQYPTWARPAEADVAGVRKAFATIATIRLAS